MFRMGKLNKVALIGGLAFWYLLTGPSSKQLESKREYPLPAEIKVIETSLPYETRGRVGSPNNLNSGSDEKRYCLDKIVKTSSIDFSDDFYIKTERYNLIKKEELSKPIGHILSIPTKLYFWDWDLGWGLDEGRTKAVLSMLEENKKLSGLTVRINHNEPLYDCYRLFGDEKVADRNNFLARLLLGTVTSLGGELFSELRRGDYYNPMNQTAVLYSNIESISAHEIGHHIDCQRFNSDWEYTLFRILPPVMLYQEWQASQNATTLLSKDDQWQFNRYLLPAFLTYLIATYYMGKKVTKGKESSE